MTENSTYEVQLAEALTRYAAHRADAEARDEEPLSAAHFNLRWNAFAEGWELLS